MSERMNARLKDEFGGNTLRVRGARKVMAHRMFGILTLTVDQWLRLSVSGQKSLIRPKTLPKNDAPI